ncbi:carbohydrate ABC transporter permease [Pseudoneobacillus sp. C159]
MNVESENTDLSTFEKENRLKSFRLFEKFDQFNETTLAKLYISPTILVLILIVLFPVCYALFLSFNDVQFVQGKLTYTFVGFDNYLRVLEDVRIPNILFKTVFFTIITVVGTIIIAFGIALSIHHSVWGASLFKRLFLIPWALSNVVNALMWKWMYSGSNGIINEIMVKLGLIEQYKIWLTDPSTALGAIILADIWKSTPFAALLILTALQTIPKDLYDASEIDGAGSLAQFRFIVLPTIRPILLVVFIIQTMWTLRVFDLIWVLTQGGPVDKTMILNVYAYEQAFRFFEIGYGSALAYLITFATIILTFLYIKVLGKGE